MNMRLMMRVSAVLVSTAMAASCSHGVGNLDYGRFRPDTSVTDTVVADFREEGLLLLDDVVESVSYIRLETDPACPIGRVDRILFADSAIVIVDFRIASAVYLFDYEGHFIKQVSKPGNGPHEYLNLNYVAMTADKRHVVIQDRMKRRFLWFDMEGNYVKTTGLAKNGGNVEYVSSDYLVHDAEGIGGIVIPNDNSSFVMTDSALNIRYSFGEQMFSAKFNTTLEYNLYRCGDRILGRRVLDGNIYEFREDGVHIPYHFELLPDDYSRYSYEDVDTYFEDINNHVVLDQLFIEMDNHSYFTLMQGEKKPYLYNHRTRRVAGLSTTFNDPMLAFFWWPFTTCGGDCIVSVAEPYSIVSYKAVHEQVGPLPERFMELYDAVSIDDNPVLFFYNLKVL